MRNPTPRGYFPALLEECEQRVTHMPTLRGRTRSLDRHQRDAMDKVCIAIDKRCSGNRHNAFSIVHCCGSGKSTLAANIIGASQKVKSTMGLNGERRDLILTTERAHQSAMHQELAHLGIEAGIWGKGMHQLSHPVIVASIDAIQRKTEQELQQLLPLNNIDIVIGDEADRYLTESRSEKIKVMSPNLRIGLTATPKWPDGRHISNLWGEIIDELPLKEGIRRGINPPPLWHLFGAAIDESRLTLRKGDYDTATLDAALKHIEIDRGICEIYKTLVPKEKRKEYPTLVYVPSANLVRATVMRMEDEFGDGEFTVHGWTGKDTSHRQIRLDQDSMNEGLLDVLVMCEMGGRAMDIPRVRCLIDGYPTLSGNKLEQRHGRALRSIKRGTSPTKEGFKKPFTLVAQIAPCSGKFRPICLPDILDGWGYVKEGRPISCGNPDSEGAPVLEQVEMIKKRIEKRNPRVHVFLREKMDMFKELKRRDQLPQADTDGFFWHREEWYGTVNTWHNYHGVAAITLHKKLREAEFIEGKAANGQLQKYYSESTLWKYCENTLKDIPQAGSDGFFVHKGKKYGTIRAWSRILNISDATIRKAIKGLKGIEGKDHYNQMRSFFSENIIRKHCKEASKNLPQVEKDGYLWIHDDWYATASTWEKRLGTGSSTLKKRLSEYPHIPGRDARGTTRKLYAQETVYSLQIIGSKEDLPHANNDGFFWENNDWYSTVSRWANWLGVGAETLRKRLRGAPCIRGIAKKNVEHDYYAQETVWECCKDVLPGTQSLKRNRSGFYEREGERYGSVKQWANHFQVNIRSARGYMRDAPSIKGQKELGRLGSTAKLYSEKEFEKRCSSLMTITKSVEVKKDGFCWHNDTWYGTTYSWGKWFGLGKTTVTNRVPQEKCIKGKYAHTHSKLYAQEDVLEYCSDLIEGVLQTDDEGFVWHNDQWHGTVRAWAGFHPNISYATIQSKMKDSPFIMGKGKKGPGKLYAEQDILDKCADLIEDLPQADEDGFFTHENERYGTAQAWGNLHDLHASYIGKRLNDYEGIKGKDPAGHVRKFYPESAVWKKCSDLLE